ncbi:nuclear cap-binding protein subunit 1, partial [Phenoliferia sp. Uapishka_3]
MAYNPNFNPSYNNGGGRNGGGGGGGGYGGGNRGNGGYQQQQQWNDNGPQRKRGRDDESQDGNYRRRNNERGDYSAPRRDIRGMGGNGGGGGGMQGGYAPQVAQSTLHQKFKDSLWQLGAAEEYDPVVELPILATMIEMQFHRDSSLVFDSFRVAIAEIPHKIPHYAALISYLSLVPSVPIQSLASRIDSKPPPVQAGLPSKPIDATTGEGEAKEEVAGDDVEMKAEEEAVKAINIGRAILEDLSKALQDSLDERKWRSARYLILLFTSLTSLPSTSSPLVSSASLIVLLTSFTAVLSEPGLRASRGDECVRVVVESMLRMEPSESGETDGLKDSVQSYLAARRIDREVFGGEVAQDLEDKIDLLVSTLTSDSPIVIDVFPSIFASLPTPTFDSKDEDDPFVLPVVTLPSADLDEVKNENPGPKVKSSGLRGDEGVGYEGVRLYLKLFDDDTVPANFDPSGTVIRSLIFDIIDLYEINRKECATILLSLPKWCKKGTFMSKNDEEDIPSDAHEWSLENLIVESILTSLFALPRPRLPSSYYHSVLTELCRLSPQTIAPSLGKCVRKLYAALGQHDTGLMVDPEELRRFAEWFSVHLSNFGFMWGWGDWAKDMEVENKHPKRVFVERVIELETRLSYFDRVRGTIPEVMLETGVMAEDAPGPNYAYESTEHTHAAAAASLLRLMRSKGTIPEVESELASFQSAIVEEHGITEEQAAVIKRDMTIQTVLSVGSRSFSHFLNVLERYLPLLRTLSPSPSTRLELLTTVSSFWSRNAQFRLIVLDKLLQYRLVDSADLIAWAFADRPGKTWSDLDLWATLKSTFSTIEGRCVVAKKRAEKLKKEKDERRERDLVGGQDAIETDEADEANAELVVAVAQAETVESELTTTIIEIVRQFDLLLAAFGNDKSDWESWWVEGWFREFCRSMAESRLLARSAVVEGIEKLALEPTSAVVSILDSAKAWNEFA